MKVLKNYKQTIILLSSVILGIILGLIFKEKITIISPLGDLFLNMLLIIIVPLIFLSITISIYKIKEPQRISKVLITTFIVFLLTSLIAVLIGLIFTKSFRLINNNDSLSIKENINYTSEELNEDFNLLSKTVDAISTNDFIKLLSKENMIALIVVAIITGFSMIMSKEKASPFNNFLESAYDILMNFIKIIMYYAPIGLCAYIASLVGTIGKDLAMGYLRTFIIYLIASLVIYFVIYTLYSYIGGGIKGVKVFWKNILTPTLTSLATCSSAASIPVNIEYSKKMGIPKDIVETTVSLGTNFHKDGSVLGSVFKIMFLVQLFNSDIPTIKIIFIALIATLLVTAVPIGGGTISEMLIITMLGFPAGVLPLLTIIATIIDSPATMLNVTGDSASAMLTTRFIEGNHWITKKS